MPTGTLSIQDLLISKLRGFWIWPSTEELITYVSFRSIALNASPLLIWLRHSNRNLLLRYIFDTPQLSNEYYAAGKRRRRSNRLSSQRLSKHIPICPAAYAKVFVDALPVRMLYACMRGLLPYLPNINPQEFSRTLIVARVVLDKIFSSSYRQLRILEWLMIKSQTPIIILAYYASLCFGRTEDDGRTERVIIALATREQPFIIHRWLGD